MYVKLIRATTSGRWQLDFGSSIQGNRDGFLHVVWDKCSTSHTLSSWKCEYHGKETTHVGAPWCHFPLYYLSCTAWNILRTEVLPSHTWLEGRARTQTWKASPPWRMADSEGKCKWCGSFSSQRDESCILKLKGQLMYGKVWSSLLSRKRPSL